MQDFDIRAIAFYLPQFHPIPENDAWWGKGFTEWTNVSRGRPLFRGHYQPHLPADLGFYDLRLSDTREAQARLAKEHGIFGFCYYHYWFSGRRLLERPFSEVLASRSPNFPFCLCWANENWTRRWDGLDKEVLIQQDFKPEDPLRMIEELLPAFHDNRYIRVNGKPLFLVYRAELLQDPLLVTSIWREAARRSGLRDLYLVHVQNFRADIAPSELGFDAAVEFPPGGRLLIPANRIMRLLKTNSRVRRMLRVMGIIPTFMGENFVVDYSELVNASLSRLEVPYRRFRCVAPGWDNSARRRGGGATVFARSTPELYESWLQAVVDQTRIGHPPDEQLVFINAWNEWAEGAHLEPCQKWGRSYLQATLRALTSRRSVPASIKQT